MISGRRSRDKVTFCNPSFRLLSWLQDLDNLFLASMSIEETLSFLNYKNTAEIVLHHVRFQFQFIIIQVVNHSILNASNFKLFIVKSFQSEIF